MKWENLQNYKGQTKKIRSIQEGTDKTQVTTESLKNNIIYYLLAVICVTAFFSHELVPSKTEEFVIAKSNHLKAKDKRTLALNNLKEASIELPEYGLYLKEKEATDKAWEELLEVAENDKFLGFENFQQFLGEFGIFLGLFIYSFFNLVISCIRRKSALGEKILHSTLMFISMYYIGWSFNFNQDYLQSTYIIATIFFTALVILSTTLLISFKNRYINSLYTNIRELIGFVFKNTKPESEDKMWNLLRNIKNDR